MNEFDDKIERYITKLDSHPKFLFLKYFRLPKNLPLFTISTTVIFSEIELLAHIWIPSLLAIYLIWECLVSFLEKEEIAFQCSVEESVFDDQCLEGDPMFENMFPGEPMRVTEEDRDFILLTRAFTSQRSSTLPDT